MTLTDSIILQSYIESEKLKLLNEQLYAKQLEALNKKESLLLNDPSTFNVDMSSGHESKKGDIFKREEMSLHFDDDQVDTTVSSYFIIVLYYIYIYIYLFSLQHLLIYILFRNLYMELLI